MNQHDQMREALLAAEELAEEAHGNGNNWNEWCLPRLKKIQEALAAEPFNFTDSVRQTLEQFEHLPEGSKADYQRAKQALFHVNETPKNEHDSVDVLKRAPLMRLTDEEIASEYSKADAYLMLCDECEFGLVARAIQNAMQEKNK